MSVDPRLQAANARMKADPLVQAEIARYRANPQLIAGQRPNLRPSDYGITDIPGEWYFKIGVTDSDTGLAREAPPEARKLVQRAAGNLVVGPLKADLLNEIGRTQPGHDFGLSRGPSAATEVAGIDATVGKMGAGGWAIPAATTAPSLIRRAAEDGMSTGRNMLEDVIRALFTGLPALLAKRGPSDEEKALMAQAQQLQAMQQKRIQFQNPLFESVSRLAMSRLPTGVQRPLEEG